MLQVEIDQHLEKFENFIFFYQNLYIFGAICNQKKYHYLYIATSIFDLHMRIFNFQGVRAPDKLKKKISTQKLILHLTTVF
jgi:hypothetical protein